MILDDKNIKFDLILRHKKLFSGYRSVTKYKTNLPLILKKNKLFLSKKWNAGRSTEGRIVMWTKSSLKKKLIKPVINYSFRSTKLGFIGSVFLSPDNNSSVALYTLSDGSYTYLRPTTSTQIFTLTRSYDLMSMLSQRTHLHNYLSFLFDKFIIKPSIFILRNLPRNYFISMLELYPGKKIQYVRSPGSKSKMLKMDTRTGTAIVKLPSGVKKVFSVYSLSSLGEVLFSSKKLFKNNKAGHYNNLGYKSRVRGVAMNPVDHPHGGRTKAIKYQRTPWGKTTKFK